MKHYQDPIDAVEARQQIIEEYEELFLPYEPTKQRDERLSKEAKSLLPPRVTYAQHHEAMALKRRVAKGMSWQQCRRWIEAHGLQEFDDDEVSICKLKMTVAGWR